MGIEAGPDGTESEGVGCQQYILGCSGYVLHPECRVIAVEEALRVAADGDGHWCFGCHLGVWEGICEGVKDLAIVYEDEFPGLAVYS